MSFDIKNFTAKIICEGQHVDTKIETIVEGNELQLHLSATKDKPKFVELHWEADTSDDLLVLGDTWERSYANLQFEPLSDTRYMPWYFIATNKVTSFCFGVKTGCNSFVSFRYDKTGITALVDLRNGGSGVHLGGRKLHLTTFVYASYDNAEIYENLRDYCKKLCPNPILPKEKIYGGNNWYYAYGKSDYAQIISDAKLQAKLAEGIDNKPFQVIDDCWQKNKCEGPWLPNSKFKDMEKLATEIKEIGARPGIWVRLLHNRDRSIKRSMRIKRGFKLRPYFDPTHPAVQKFIRADIERIRNWGYELLKHDFSTADLFGNFGGDFVEAMPKIEGWHFYDKTKTNAEIVLDFYRLIKEAAGDMLIIGCNTISHLSAGMVHIYRTGDDTSGTEWNRTRDFGVNTLAFRLAQNEIFYMCDADCVGIIKGKIPWEKNKQWLHLLSYSNTPLFVSCTDEIDDEQFRDLKEAYNVFHKPHEFKPIDIYDTKTPTEWLIDGEVVKYNW